MAWQCGVKTSAGKINLSVSYFPDIFLIYQYSLQMMPIWQDWQAILRLPKTPRCGLYITLGTGVGTSLILNGNLYKELSDCEGGHMSLNYNGKITTWEEVAAVEFTENFGELSSDTPLEVWEEVPIG